MKKKGFFDFLKGFAAAIGVIFILSFAAVKLIEGERIHATESFAMALFDTTTAPRWNGELRYRRQGGDTSAFISKISPGNRQWFYVPFTAYKITDVDIIRWNTYTYIVNGTGLDTLVYPVNDSTFRIKSIRTIGSNGLKVASTIDAQSILYNVSVGAISVLSADSVTTSNATATTLKTFTIDPNSIGVITIDMTGMKTDGTGGITGKKVVRYKKVGTTLTLGTVTAILADEADAAVSGATWSITTSSNNVIIQVTGVAATSIDWRTCTAINNHPVFP